MSGEVRYNGCTASEFDLQRTASYVDQVGCPACLLLPLTPLSPAGPTVLLLRCCMAGHPPVGEMSRMQRNAWAP